MKRRIPWNRQQEIAEELDLRLWMQVVEKIKASIRVADQESLTEQHDDELDRHLRLAKQRSLLWRYVPWKKQLWWHRAKNRKKIFSGSNQSGKTTALVAEKLTYRLGYRPWLLGKDEFDVDTFGQRYGLLDVLSPRVIEADGEFYPTQGMTCVKDYVNTVTEVLVPKFREMFPLEYLCDIERVQGRTPHKFYFYNGSTEKFYSGEQDSDKLEGATWHDGAADEPLTRDHFVAMQRGLAAKRSPTLFTMTLLKEPWIHDELIERAVIIENEDLFERSQRDVNTIFATQCELDENPYMSKEAKEEFAASLRPEEIETRIKGRPRSLVGLVLPEFDMEMHVREIEIPSEALFGLVVDPHSRKPFAMAWFAITPRNEMVFFAEWPHDGTAGWPRNDFGPLPYHQVSTWNWGVREYLEEIERIESGENEAGVDMRGRVFWRLMDPGFGRTKSASSGRTLQEDFEKSRVRGTGQPTAPEDYVFSEEVIETELMEGLSFDCDFTNSLEVGHLAIRDRLFIPGAAPTLFFTPACRHIIHAIRHYSWDEYRNWQATSKGHRENVREKYKDFMDVVRYACVIEPLWFEMDPYGPYGSDPGRLQRISRGGLGE